MTFPNKTIKKIRNSNLELYRIIVMLLIVAHHYVVNSGLFEVLRESPASVSTVSMILFGAWGKTGINCFVLITGYFLCRSSFSWRKLLKLYLQLIFYAIIIYGILCFTGHESFSAIKSGLILFPIKSLTKNFLDCFLVFYLFIPFLNKFLSILDKRNHTLLCILLITFYTILPSNPYFSFSFNYVEWFIALYIFAAYLRNYSYEWKISHRHWGYITILMFVAGCMSILVFYYAYTHSYYSGFQPYFFISDSNKILALGIAVSSFMWFKDLKFRHLTIVNKIGATTFGVLLIHANSDAMRQWLWRETIDCKGHFEALSPTFTLAYAIVSVVTIFSVCALIDWLRGEYLEPLYLSKLESLLTKRKSKKIRVESEPNPQT